MLLNIFSQESKTPYQPLIALLFLLAQLVITGYLIWKFEIESSIHLMELWSISVIGFIIQLALPKSIKPIFFLLLSLTGLFIFIGWINALGVIAIGLSLFAAASYIKVQWLRLSIIAVLFGVIALLALIGNKWIQDHFIIISVTGSMFIYRIWIYQYDLKYQKENPGFIQNISYFFMLPNLAFLLFPAVDYKNFISKQYDDKDLLIYKKGVQWITLGTFHLIVYRFVYYNLLIPTSEVTDVLSFCRYATMNYALVIRLSGLFHISAGILCLFGYNMPATFNNYFLATGFSDLWRRLNIYFKDFMVKVFYYPIYFKLRKFGSVRAIFATILALFFISWMLHSLQWFWFKGNFPWKWADAIYWNTFGILVAINAIYDLRKSRQTTTRSNFSRAAITTAHIILTFSGMSLLWSLWSASTIEEWVVLLKIALTSDSNTYLVLVSIVGGTWILGTSIYLLIERYHLSKTINPPHASASASFWSMSMLGGLLLLLIPASTNFIEQSTQMKMDGILKDKLTIADEQQQVEGYYTDILLGSNITNPAVGLSTQKTRQFRNTPGAITIFDYRNIIMRPDTSFLFKDETFTINQWGFRDKEYALNASPKTIRSVLMGGSFVAGSGVADAEVFDVILENRMNSTSDSLNYEFLNYGCPAYDLIDCIIHFEQENIAKFLPSYLFYISHGKDFFKNSKDIATCLTKGIPIPLGYLQDIITRSGVNSGMTEPEMIKRLSLFEEEILIKSYDYLFRLCKTNNITPVWIYWPAPAKRLEDFTEKEKVMEIARKAGFIIIDIDAVYKNNESMDIQLSEKDIHPNAKGHQLVADELYQIFKETKLLLPNPGNN
ncbi:MAG: hypothetical protein KA479_06300 [Saprospiraceae bacterium]|nr:hypothetical protein [Saprospiraceae bacterium]